MVEIICKNTLKQFHVNEVCGKDNIISLYISRCSINTIFITTKNTEDRFSFCEKALTHPLIIDLDNNTTSFSVDFNQTYPIQVFEKRKELFSDDDYSTFIKQWRNARRKKHSY